MGKDVAVIIPAYRAAWCIADAVTSALAQGEVAEVLVIDDASPDDTVERARACDDGSGRLRIIIQDRNRGPAAARNRGIEESSSPLIALLDADDRFAPDRFVPLLAIEDPWDFIADDILFVAEASDYDEITLPQHEYSPRNRLMDLGEFVQRNRNRRRQRRSELGFLKPVMRRRFLEQNDLAYLEDLRLGEDFILYATALSRNAKFRLIENCGYYAIEHNQSLSSQHSEGDLMALAQETAKLAKSLPRGEERTMLEQLADATMLKSLHRQFLSLKRDKGPAHAIARFAGNPSSLAGIAGKVMLDKVAAVKPARLPRRLFSSDDFEKN